MSEEEKKELIDDLLEYPNSYFPVNGIDATALVEYINIILSLPIDLNQIPIEWILWNIANMETKNDTPYKSIAECLVDESTFEERFKETYSIYNPIIYKLLVEAAKTVEKPLMKPETQIEYLKKEIEKIKKEKEKETDPFMEEMYDELIEKNNNIIEMIKKGTTSQK